MPPSVIDLATRQAQDVDGADPTPDGAATSAATRPGEAQIVAYDFRRPTKVSRDHVRSLQMAFDTMARRLTTLLTSGLRAVCQVHIEEITQLGYDDCMLGLGTPSVTVPLALQPIGANGVLNISVPVVLAAIDHMLGGPGGDQPTRTLTDIEVPLLQGLLGQITGVLRYAFEPFVDLEATAGTVEYNPQFLQAAGPSDAMIHARFTLQIGAVESQLLLCLPLAPMLPYLDAQTPEETGVDAAAQAAFAGRLAERVIEVGLDVGLQFDPVTLTADRVLDLAVGDVLDLRVRAGAPLGMYAGGLRYAGAVAGKTGSRLAALVVESPETPTRSPQR